VTDYDGKGGRIEDQHPDVRLMGLQVNDLTYLVPPGLADELAEGKPVAYCVREVDEGSRTAIAVENRGRVLIRQLRKVMTETDFSYKGAFGVIITDDKRGEGKYGPAGCLTEKPGVCLGRYDPETMRPDKEGYPLIIAESGDEMWGGRNCWWMENDDASIEELREVLEPHKEGLRERFGLDLDSISWN
jgi:hypothetical protein